MISYVLSVLGEDRAGLVEALSGVVTAHGGNWERSHMTQLAGKFAGVVLVTVPSAQSEGFLEALSPLQEQGLLDISVEAGRMPEVGESPTLRVELVGNDHPGIVHEVSQLLARHKVNIDDLQTWTSEAPMHGGTLFHATAIVRLPAGLAAEELSASLETLATDLMVDIEVAGTG